MFLTDKYESLRLSSLFLVPIKKHHNYDHHPPPHSKAFDEALIARLRSLLPIPGPTPSSVPLAWLYLAVQVLSNTLSDTAALVSDPSLPTPCRSALASHLDSGIALLDACNAISAHIDRLLRRRLLLRFALQLLSSSPQPQPPEALRRARKPIKEWEESPKPAIRGSASDLIKSLGPSDPPRGKISAVRRAIYAVEAVSSLVAGAVVAVLGGGEKRDLAGIRASGEFPWAEAFNEVAAALSDKLPGSAVEVEVLEVKGTKLAAVIDGEDDGEKAERLRIAIEETEKATDQLTDGLERLSNAVNELFRVGLSTRNTALQSFRVGPQKCK